MANVLADLLSSVKRVSRPRRGREGPIGDDVIVLLAHLHCLPSTVALFTRLWEDDLKLDLNRIILIPKPYSTIKPVLAVLRATGVNVIDDEVKFDVGYYDQVMNKLLKNGCGQAKKICDGLSRAGKRPRLILVDDGGMLTEIWWKGFYDTGIEVVSVQQTASGVHRMPAPYQIAKIDVSRSAAKRHFESKIISSGVLRKIARSPLSYTKEQIGIVGVGALGKALAVELTYEGYTVFLYDEQGPQANVTGGRWCSDIGELLKNCELIFGCTGSNFIDDCCLQILSNVEPRTFISCSSRDIEFLSLIRDSKTDRDQADPFGRICVQVGSRLHYVVNGGFPINFDREEEQETSDEISLTRGLVLAGILQAASLDLSGQYRDLIMLGPDIQRELVGKWLKLTGARSSSFGVSKEDFADMNWWIARSSGTHIEDTVVATSEVSAMTTLRRVLSWIRW